MIMASDDNYVTSAATEHKRDISSNNSTFIKKSKIQTKSNSSYNMRLGSWELKSLGETQEIGRGTDGP